MDFRFTAHNPQTGEFLHRLPRAEKVQIGDTFGTRGTLELTYSAKALNAKPMPTFVEIRQQVTFDSGANWSDIGPNYLRLSGSHEDTDQAGMRTVKFVSREWLLGKARVGNGDLELIDGKRPFYQSSPGQIMRTLILEAKDRGAAQGIEIGGFTASKDSAGNTWGKVATIYYSPGLPILDVLENLVEQGMCDYRMDGNTIRLFEPETTMGRDLTTGTNPVRVHGSVTEAPVSYTLEDLTTSALLVGEEGFSLEVDNPSAPNDYGRLEVTIEQGGVNQAGTARIMVDEALNRGSREIREITRTQRADGLKFLPYRDYRVGDFVQVRDLGGWQRYRVREIQAVREADGWSVHTILNDRLQELLLKLAKRTNGIVNGSKGSGGDGTRPAPPAKPGIEPAAPEGLVIDQNVYLDRQGVARGAVTAGWGAVTQSTKGEAIEIGGYELWWRENETMAVWRRASSVVDSLTVTHSPVVLSDAFGEAMEYQWRVRAIAEASARPGPWSSSVTLTMTQDTEPPNVPSTPDVKTDLRIITVGIDGLDEYGEAMPVDYNHHRIYFAESANMADAVQVGTLSNPGTWNSESMIADAPVYVAVTAVDNVGNESEMTPSQLVTPQKLVDDDAIREQLDGLADGTLIKDDAITTPKILANAITAGKIAALAIEADHISANAITADKINAGAIDGKLITGARIRTSASGARVELNSEGLKAYRSNGDVVLNTDTSDGSIDMTGNLSQTRGGVTMTVGQAFSGSNPGIRWNDANGYRYSPGIAYSQDGSRDYVYIQAPGTTTGNAYLSIDDSGNGFDLNSYSSQGGWRVTADNPGGSMRVGSSIDGAPYMGLKRGATGTGYARVRYLHPDLPDAFGLLSIEHAEIFLGTHDSTGAVVSRLWGDTDSTELTAGTRKMSVRGGDGAYMNFAKTSNGARVQSGTIYSTTSDKGYSVRVNDSGTLFSESSSLRYKQDVTPASDMPTILDVEPKVWRNKSSMENARKLAALREEIGQGPAPVAYAEAKDESEVPWDYGAIAEEVDDLGLTDLVLYDRYDRPDALQYEKFGVALIPIVRGQRDLIDELEQRLGKLEEKCHTQ